MRWVHALMAALATVALVLAGCFGWLAYQQIFERPHVGWCGR